MAAILHVIDDLDYGGAQTQLRLQVEAACASGEGATVASLRRPGAMGSRLREAGGQVVWLGRRFPVDPFACRRLSRLLRDGAFQAVQTWDAASARHVLIARRGVSSVARWLHVVREQGKPDGFERRARAAADCLVTPSPTIAEALIQYGAAPERVAVVPNHSEESPADTAPRNEVLRRLGLPLSSRLIAAAMRFDTARLAKELVWAADLVRVVHPEVRLVLVGDGPARRRVERFAREASEPGLAVFTGWCDEWADLLSASEVVWSVSDSPDAPTPLIEAMRVGKPVVANEAPGRDRLVTDAVTGWLTPWDHRAGWARATVRMLEDPALAQRIGEAGRGRARDATRAGVASLTTVGVVPS